MRKQIAESITRMTKKGNEAKPTEDEKMKPNYSKIRQYILAAIRTDDDCESLTDKECFEHVRQRFNSEYGFNLGKRGLSNQAVFAQWLAGLAINIAFMNNDIIKLAKRWGSLPANGTERQKERIIENYFSFMAMQFFKFARREGLELID
jgi:hypothetical protein